MSDQSGAGGSPRVWFITGASSGFGHALAVAAIAAGDVVIATARNTGALQQLVADTPDRVEAIPLDVTDPAAAQAAIRDVEARYGRIDVLVNNAGRGHVGAAEETTDEDLRSLFELHFFGPATLIRAVLPGMRERGTGVIVQMSSYGGQVAAAGFSSYAATKFALEGYSEALALEVGLLGIDVLIVEPGAFRTGFSGGSLGESTPIDAYADTVGPTRAYITGIDGTQPGDPTRAAAAVLTAIDSDRVPLRLPLGNDAVDGITGHLHDVEQELRAWESLSRSTDFDTRKAST
ncbi:oxidoreductase [Microbacterium sp.]|uniref:oxidoreductase n=1 Tax=Microbacterium sp. TaxID=51671 RepID=UPI003C74B333